MTQSPDIKISDAAKELAQHLGIMKLSEIHSEIAREKWVLDSIQTALTAAAQEARRVALEEAAEMVDWKGDENISRRFSGHKRIAEILANKIRALANTPALSPWQPIETAPKDGTPILALFPQAYWEVSLKPSCLVIIWETWENWGLYQAAESGDLGDWVPTHWMPLPPLPNKPAGGEG